MTRRFGFTLVELLVVITIIVVLISLLAPALDQAVYQAMLVQCGAQLKLQGTGATQYAMDFGRRYPWRSGCHDPTVLVGVSLIKFIRPTGNTGPAGAAVSDPYGFDDRPEMVGYIPFEKALLDPLAGRVRIDFQAIPPDSPAQLIQVPYTIWFGFKYQFGGGMVKLGDTMRMFGQDFNVLASDLEYTDAPTDAQNAAHQDRSGVLTDLVQQQDYVVAPEFWEQTLTWWSTPWQRGGLRTRGLLDRNTVFADLSVKRHTLGPPPVDTPLNPSDNPMRIMPYADGDGWASSEPNGVAATAGYWIPAN
jgi:prepilin-type N-terminal cleavage/methylation domain-containing protein